MYRPCAPDGFIPNSVVRELYTGINNQHPTVVKEEKEWSPPVWLDEWGEMKSNVEEDDDEESKPKHWLSDDDESVTSEVSTPISTTYQKNKSKKVSFDVNKEIQDPKLYRSNFAGRIDADVLSDALTPGQNSQVSGSPITALQSDIAVSAKTDQTEISMPTKNNQSDISMPLNTTHESEDPPSDNKRLYDSTNSTSNDELSAPPKTSGDRLKLHVGQDMEEEPTLVPYPVVDNTVDIPSPFLRYYDEPWFPKGMCTDIGSVVEHIISNLLSSEEKDLRMMLQCLLETHRYCGLEGNLMDQLISSLLQLVASSSAHARLCGVRSLRELGVDRDDVILAIVPLLEDPSVDVREEAKNMLKEVAGVVDVESLTALLCKLGVFAMEEEQSPKDEEEADEEKDKSSEMIVEITPVVKQNKIMENGIDEEECMENLSEDSATNHVNFMKDSIIYNQEDDPWWPEDERMSFYQRAVPGVVGERILSEVVVVSNINRTGDCDAPAEIIRPIPERHGCATVKKDGCTMYGRLGYKWTTYSTEYDMRNNVKEKQGRDLNTQQHINHQQRRPAKHMRTKGGSEKGGFVVSSTMNRENGNPPNLMQTSIVRAYRKILIDT